MMFPPDDQPLVDFLRQHRATPPPPAPDLEQRLMATLRQTPQSAVEVERLPRSGTVPRSRRLLWLIPPAIAAGILASWTTQQFFFPASPSAAEVTSLEAFMETNWQGSVTHEPDFDRAVNPTNED